MSIDSRVLEFLYEQRSGEATSFFEFITMFGHPFIVLPLGIIIAGILLRQRKTAQAAVVGLMFAGCGLLTSFLKTVFDRPRPDDWQPLMMESSFSFPSGHASTSMIIALTVCYLLWSHKQLRLPLIAASTLFVIVIGLSRLYLGVHYPSDILGGWALASVWFTAVLGLRRFQLRRSQQS